MSQPTAPGDAIRESILVGVRERIARNGFDIVNVFGDPEVPTYSYTVGLTDLGFPELFMAGFQPSLMQGLLRDAARRAAEIRDGVPLDRVANCPLGVRKLPPAAADTFLLIAQSYHGRAVEAFQIVVPDANGLFPWQPGCDPTIVRYQSVALPFADEQAKVN